MSELEAKKILEYWYNMEYFAPFFPNKKEGDSVLYGAVEQDLPWKFENENKIFRLYIGKINVDDLITKLHDVMDIEEGVERENSITYIGKIEFNNKGEYVKESFKINTFLFAVTSIIKNKSFDIEMNEEVITKFNSNIDSIIQSNYSTINNKDNLIMIEDFILRQLDYFNEENFYCLVKQRAESENSDDVDDMFDSFYVKDISMVLHNLKSDDKIIDYITAKEQKDKLKIKIDSDVEAMKKWTLPEKYPIGKWPSKHSPSLMQQVAINIGISEEEEVKNIFSVNGPPGTGKTTLLKEVVANNIVNRAVELCKYEDPNTVLKMCTVENPPHDFYRTYYEFPSELEKFSMIVASNNNSAVENISLDLPNAFDMEADKTYTGKFDVNDLEEIYFSDVASMITGIKSWGLISAPLGNMSNIKEVKRSLNTNKNQLFGSYFNDESKKVDWKIAKDGFIKQYNLVKRYQAGIISDAKILHDSYDKKTELDRLELEHAILVNELKEKEKILADVSNNEKRNLEETKTINESIISLKNSLSFFQKLLLKISKKSIVAKNLNKLNKMKEKLLSEYSEMQVEKASSSNVISKALDELKANEKRYAELQIEYSKSVEEVEGIKDKYKTSTSDNFPDNKFFENITSNNISQKACPWTNEEYDKLREELFFRAIILQKAFVQNAKGVKQNIRMLCKAWEKKGFFEGDKQIFFKHVFHTLFLVIPVISTTFASVGNLLKYIGKEELGTLIIDEAGQAAPASAIGALWRTRKAIVVGDPLQVEPVVTSSKALSRIFINNLEIDSEYGQSELSVQELADLANPFCGEINGKSVGCPLVVHRRCIEPIFDISNKVSYGNRMFNETIKPEKNMNFSIATSRWIHCQGSENGNKDHYVREQGEIVVKLILNAYNFYGPRLFETGAKIIYVISPFTSVVNCIRARLKEEFSLNKEFNKINMKYLDEWLENSIGTVHKFQGKEADEVIFVLGCDQNSGMMAANWAGSKANILNVAVTRAKYRIVMVGDAKLWGGIQYFDDAFKILKNNFERFKSIKGN
ncbi:AAA domain-containing protein [Clostridium sp. SHJSY1]|uniref:AAA domain-containing protein n=1 Tax=Clostridium sp. SHJSY1 TaxID=2942483 RepID=UPI0028758DB1|nr:AAA domain-containing protein [Clostridium sp. SHJSY1]MDS0528451.1 AAA domain-containing protein [Clostridium sp. SHJSY1]